MSHPGTKNFLGELLHGYAVMSACVKAHITEQFRKALNHTPKAKNGLENKNTKLYAECVSLKKRLKKTPT